MGCADTLHSTDLWRLWPDEIRRGIRAVPRTSEARPLITQGVNYYGNSVVATDLRVFGLGSADD